MLSNNYNQTPISVHFHSKNIPLTYYIQALL